jgi:hypothetical protein
MVEKTVTMSMYEYKMLSTEAEIAREEYNRLKEEKWVYVTTVYSENSLFVRQMGGGMIMDKDELLSKMQKHLSLMKKRVEESETGYLQRIADLEKQLATAQAQSFVKAPVEAVKAPTKWWHKLIK